MAFSEMGGNNVRGAQSKKYRMDLDADVSSWLLPRLVRDQQGALEFPPIDGKEVLPSFCVGKNS